MWRKYNSYLDDGRLRQSSFSQLCQAAPTSSVKQRKSDVPLSGYIMALHVVRNGRTKERYVVGGGDDGSIAFWTSEYVSCFSFVGISD